MSWPRFGLIFQLFVRASRVQKKRAVLTIAAIAWGTVALLLLLAFGEGMKRQMAIGRSGMGTDLAIVWPGETSVPHMGLPVGRPVRLRMEDVPLLRQRIEGLDTAIGEMRTWGANFTFGTKTVNGRLTGVHHEYGRIRNHIPQRGGRFLNQRDQDLRRRVIFLGDEIAEDIYGSVDPVGTTLLVNKMPYLVIGVMKHKMQNGTYNGPDASGAVVPITTFRAQFGRDRLNNFVLRAATPELMPAVKRQLHEVMGGKYGFDPDDQRVFGIWDTVESSQLERNIMLGIEIFLGIIGALTLVIGGVGVANIMYAVVSERSRQIGVMMALGARRGWVIGPIVLEALFFTLFGGAIGIVIAVSILGGLQVLVQSGAIPLDSNDMASFLLKPTLSLPIGIASSAILGVIGLLAGYFPARRAASIQPAEVLRDE